MQSLAGGTGSGFGSHVVSSLREFESKLPINNVVIWPRMGGEIAI